MTEELEKESFIARQRDWLREHMAANGLSWPQIAKRVGIAAGTLSAFGVDKYQGRNDKVAQKVKEYRDFLDDQADLDVIEPDVPDYYDTPTSRAFIHQLRWAHRGKMIAIAGIPGCSKSKAVEFYRQMNPSSVVVVKILPSRAGLANMLVEVLKALGKRDEVGSPQRLSSLVMDLISDRNMLLVFDEAHELSDKAFEEIRGWHDLTGVGIALVGEPRLVQKIKATGRAAKPALSRRVTIFETHKVRPEDVEALCLAWGIETDEEMGLLKQVARLDGALGECTQVLELASIVAAGRDQARSLDHIVIACKQRGLDFRNIRGEA